MASMTQVKPDMAVLGKGGLPLFPFGLLSQTFAEEIYSHAGGTEGFYDLYDLTFLEEGVEEPEAVPPPLVQLHVDLKLVLQQLKERGQGRVAERIVEKVITTKRLHKRSIGRQVPQRQRAGDYAPLRWSAPGVQGQNPPLPQPVYGHGKWWPGVTGALPHQVAARGKETAGGTVSRGVSFQEIPVEVVPFRKMSGGALSFRGAATEAVSFGKQPAGEEPFWRTFASAEPFERATAGAKPFRGMDSKPELFREMPTGAVAFGKRVDRTAPFQEISAGEMLSGRTSYERKAFFAKAADKQAFTPGNAGRHGAKASPVYRGMGNALPYTPYAVGASPEAGTPWFPFSRFAGDIRPMEGPRPVRAVQQTSGGFLSYMGKPGGHSAAAEAMVAFPGAELVFYQEPNGDASYGSPIASARKDSFPALNLPSLSGFLLKGFPPLAKHLQDFGAEELGKARQSTETTLPAVRGPSEQIQEANAFLPFTQDDALGTGRQLTAPFHLVQTIHAIPSGWTAQAKGLLNRAGTTPEQADSFNPGQLTALPHNDPANSTVERAAGLGFPANPLIPWLSMGRDAIPEVLQLEYIQEPADLPAEVVPFQPGLETTAKKFGSAAAREIAAFWRTAIAETLRFSANHPHLGAPQPRPEAYRTVTDHAGPTAYRPDEKQNETIAFRQAAQPMEKLPLGWNIPHLEPAASRQRISSDSFPASLAAQRGRFAAMAMLTTPRPAAANTAEKTGLAEMERKQAAPSKGIDARFPIPSNDSQELPETWAGFAEDEQLSPFLSKRTISWIPKQSAAAFPPLGLEHIQETGTPLAGQAALAMEQSELPALERISKQLDSVVRKETAVLQKTARPKSAVPARQEQQSGRHPERPEYPDVKRYLTEGVRSFPDGKPRNPGMPPLAVSGTAASKPDGRTMQPGMESSRSILATHEKELPPPLDLEHVGETAGPEAVQPGRAGTGPSYERLEKQLETLGRQLPRKPEHTAATPPEERRQTGTIRQGLAGASPTASPGERRQAGIIGQGLAGTSPAAERKEGKPLAVPEKTPPVLQNLLEKAAKRWAAAEAGPATPMVLPPVELDYHTETGLTENAPPLGGSTPVRSEPSASPRQAVAQQTAAWQTIARPGGSHSTGAFSSVPGQGEAHQTIPNPMLSHRALPAQGSIQAPISHPMLSHRMASRQSPFFGALHTAFPRQPGAREIIVHPADICQHQISHRMPPSSTSRPPFGGRDTDGRSAAGAYSGRSQESYPALQMTYSTPLTALARDLRQAVGMSSIPAAEAMAAKAEPEPIQTLAQMPQPPQTGEQIVWQNPYMRVGPAETAYRQKPPAALQRQPQPQARVSDAEIRRAADKVFKLVQEKMIAERRRIGRF